MYFADDMIPEISSLQLNIKQIFCVSEYSVICVPGMQNFFEKDYCNIPYRGI